MSSKDKISRKLQKYQRLQTQINHSALKPGQYLDLSNEISDSDEDMNKSNNNNNNNSNQSRRRKRKFSTQMVTKKCCNLFEQWVGNNAPQYVKDYFTQRQKSGNGKMLSQLNQISIKAAIV